MSIEEKYLVREKVMKSDNVDAIARTFAYWLRMRKENNPRRVTLSAWAEYNVDASDETLNRVWKTYTKFI